MPSPRPSKKYEKIFCVYEHWRPDKNVCFYVGKGLQKRANYRSRKENSRHQRVERKLAASGLKIEVKIIASSLTEAEAFSQEIDRIAYWRSICGSELVNATVGGEGSSGYVMTEEQRRRMSEARRGIPNFKARGRKLSEEHKKKIGKAGKGRRLSNETIAKISAAQKGKPRPENIGKKHTAEFIESMKARVFTEDHRRKISEAKKGKPKSLEHREKLSLAQKGKKHTPETLEKLRAKAELRRGIPRSEVTRAKISSANKGKPGRKGIEPWNKGRHLLETTRLKMSIARLGKKRGPMSLVQKEKIRQTLLGRPNLALKGKPLSAEHRQKLADAWQRRKANAATIDEQAR